MWRRVTVISGVLLLAFFYVNRSADPSYLFLSAPFVFLLIFYFLIVQDHFSAAAVIVCPVFFIVQAILQTHNSAFLLLLAVLALALYGVFLYQRNWSRSVREVEQKKQLMFKEAGALQERYQVRIESLKHLEQRVSSLVHLFEIARDFNECLNFVEMLSVIDQKIAQELSFSRGALILLSGTSKTDKQIEHRLTFGSLKRASEDLFEKFVDGCLRVLGPSNQPVKIENGDRAEENQFSCSDVQFPLWLFPLFIERQLIAILAIEGGGANDFQKCEVLASQLALQVKKIRLYETVKENSIVDGLTNVFVRRHFLERFQEELKRAFRYQFSLSVLMVDVDHFKSYNDKFGHLVGDKTLREVAQVIRENVRRVDVIGRYGGEEFVIVAPEIAKAQGQELAERIRSAVARKRLRIYDEDTQITVSIGVSSFPEDLADKAYREYSDSCLSLLIEKADKALYMAKEEGRNRVVTYR